MTTATREKVNLLDLLPLEDEVSFRLGGRVCVTRLGRPWRVCEVVSLAEDILTVTTGHQYDARSGLPLREAKGIKVQPLKREHVEYLMVVELQKVAEKINLRQLSEAQWRFLLPAATRVLTLLQELKSVSPAGVQDWHRTLKNEPE